MLVIRRGILHLEYLISPLLLCFFQCAEQLRRLGAQLDACDKHGRTALHFVAFNGAFRSLRWLLNRGADWRLRGKRASGLAGCFVIPTSVMPCRPMPYHTVQRSLRVPLLL